MNVTPATARVLASLNALRSGIVRPPHGLVQRPAVQGTPLQQSALTVHCCP
jgi:hypothetical protein